MHLGMSREPIACISRPTKNVGVQGGRVGGDDGVARDRLSTCRHQMAGVGLHDQPDFASRLELEGIARRQG